jgi:hypothetical protein
MSTAAIVQPPPGEIAGQGGNWRRVVLGRHQHLRLCEIHEESGAPPAKDAKFHDVLRQEVTNDIDVTVDDLPGLQQHETLG